MRDARTLQLGDDACPRVVVLVEARNGFHGRGVLL
jgi:hypothetical protein